MRNLLQNSYLRSAPLRRVLALCCLIVWVLGMILPIIPGWPALIVAIALLGRRDRALRQIHLLWRRSLRWLRRHPIYPLRSTGRWISSRYVELRRALTPHIASAERTFGG
ncbi:MAG: hypothetical protein AB4911_24895 [Oscillochloridaceae bacterium umkhey_bin13]